MSEIAQISAKFPLLSCWRSGTHWTGFITIHGRLLRLSINAPKFPSIQDMKLEGSEEMEMICRPLQNDVSEVVKEEMTLLEFMTIFTELLNKSSAENCYQTPVSNIEIFNPEFYNIILEELDQIGLEKISYVADNYGEIHVSHFDASSRPHVVKFLLSSRYPYVSLKVLSELPFEDAESFLWSNKVSESNQLFLNELQKYNDFWTEMDVIDETRVIDPAKPNRSHTYRRILIQEKVVMHLTLNPLRPRIFPEVHLTGPEKVVGELDQFLEKYCDKWNECRSVLDNLQDILQLEFFLKRSADDGENQVEIDLNCTICYMYELEGNVPERSCVCSAPFHNRCLYDLYVNDFAGSGKKFVDCPVCSAELRILATFK